jgi:hemolysin D
MERTKIEDSADPGLFVLEILLRLHGIDADAEQLRRRIGYRAVGITEMLRYAKETGLKARHMTTAWERLASCPLPGIATLRGGGFLLLGKVTRENAVVLAPGAERPALMTRDEFESQWDGQLVLMGKHSALANMLLRYGRTWIIRANDTSRHVVGTVRRLAKPNLPAAQLGTIGGATAVIDFADRARKLGRSVGFLRPDDHRRRSYELAFLPAALEIVETPPSPLGRAIALSIIAVFGIALAWACIGTVDIVAVAPGKLIPSGRTKIIQPFEAGILRSIQVHDGQSVKSGDVLIELDTTMSGAELGHLKSDLLAARLDAARLRAALAERGVPLAAFTPPEDAPPALVEMHRRFLISKTAEQNAKLSAIDRQVMQKEAERATIKSSIEKLKATLVPLEQRVEIREHLFQKELGSKLTYLTELQDLVGQRQEILVQESRYGEAEAAIAVLMETRKRTVAEYERGLLDELAKSEQKAAGLAQEVIKAEQRTSLQKLMAPIDGTIQQLAVHTIGGVVTPAQRLMLVVPTDSPLEIEAIISNRDIGFVEVGQDASIKIDTFSFTRYGLLHGKILNISQDAITRTTPQDREGGRSRGAETTISEPTGQELVYAARVSIDRTQMEVENKRVNLSPGMAATVEIKTGSRSVISYLVSPLVRYKQESLRER